jgi:hypothetical protein
LRTGILVNPLIVIGLFFYSSLFGGIDRSIGGSAEVVGHLVNLGGMLAGMLIGMLLEPESPGGDGW